MIHNELLQEVKGGFDYVDAWGHCMGWLFAIAGEIHDRCQWPDAWDAWEYSPSASGGRDPDDYWGQLCADATTADLLTTGDILWRYRSMLLTADRSY